MRRVTLIGGSILVSVLGAFGRSSGPAAAHGQMWVTQDRAARHTCPSVSCGIVGNFLFRESVEVLETEGDWARVTRRYDASCSNGRSQYVDTGNARCEASNGIEDGAFAEWVALSALGKTRPDDPGTGATGTAALVAQSDDFRLHEEAFVIAADELITSGDCSADDLTENGGFVKSTSAGPSIYFTYCGGGSDRIYLDVSDGRTYR